MAVRLRGSLEFHVASAALVCEADEGNGTQASGRGMGRIVTWQIVVKLSPKTRGAATKQAFTFRVIAAG